MLLQRRCCRDLGWGLAVRQCRRLLSTEGVTTSTFTFENILSDENKARAQTKIDVVLPERGTKEYPLKPDFSYAAVLVPFCLVKNEPSLLFTLRSTRLKKHRGQVSFPGGNMDKTDRDFVHTALRETHEELGIEPSAFDVWGQMQALPSSQEGRKLVYPIMASTGEIDLKTLDISHEEVEEAFTVTVRHLCEHANFGQTMFRSGYTLPVYTGGPHRIWGLTAVVVHQALNIVVPELYKSKVVHRKPVHKTGGHHRQPHSHNQNNSHHHHHHHHSSSSGQS